MSDDELDVSDRYERLSFRDRADWIESHMVKRDNLTDIAAILAMPCGPKRDKVLLDVLNKIDDEAATSWCRQQINRPRVGHGG